jgi:hypothetical protein
VKEYHHHPLTKKEIKKILKGRGWRFYCSYYSNNSTETIYWNEKTGEILHERNEFSEGEFLKK